MRLVAIIQARMGSSRLPGKVSRRLGSRRVLEHVVERARQAGVFADVCVATTELPADDAVVLIASECDATIVRGSEHDVLSRYAKAAAATRADAIARITSDCPLIDPDVLNAMAAEFLDAQGNAQGGIDLVTNARRRTFPRGLDAEFFSRGALDAMLAEADEPHHREHVTPFLYEHPERFRIRDYVSDIDNSSLRLTLDTAEDFDLLERIFLESGSADGPRLGETLAILRKHPEWVAINAHIEQKHLK